MKIPFFRYPEFFKSQEEDIIRITREVGRRGAFILQSDLEEFERKIANYLNVPFAVGVANATDGLQMGFMAGGIQPGDEIIFCSHTMVATASAIYYSGAVPVPAEAGKDHLIDPDKIKDVITPRTKAICPTQLNGRTANMDKILQIAEEYNLQIYEDAAQGLGSKWNKKFAGTFGVASCISFYPAKILGCLGDGGMVITSDEQVYNKLKLLRDHGREGNDVVLWGLNSRLDNLQAAYLSHQFDNYDNVIRRRQEIATMYDNGLKSIDEVVLPAAPGVDANHFDVFQNYEIEAEQRDALRNFLEQNGIGTLIQWGGKPVHKFDKLGFNQKLPFTEELFQRLIMLPMNMFVTDEEVDFICQKIRQFYNK